MNADERGWTRRDGEGRMLRPAHAGQSMPPAAVAADGARRPREVDENGRADGRYGNGQPAVHRASHWLARASNYSPVTGFVAGRSAKRTRSLGSRERRSFTSFNSTGSGVADANQS